MEEGMHTKDYTEKLYLWHLASARGYRDYNTLDTGNGTGYGYGYLFNRGKARGYGKGHGMPPDPHGRGTLMVGNIKGNGNGYDY